MPLRWFGYPQAISCGEERNVLHDARIVSTEEGSKCLAMGEVLIIAKSGTALCGISKLHFAATARERTEVLTMRLIDAGKAKLALDWNLVGNTADVACRIIDSVPTVDAVPVLRCKDCEDWELGPGGIPICWETCEPMPPDGFCSLGKRKPSADG